MYFFVVFKQNENEEKETNFSLTPYWLDINFNRCTKKYQFYGSKKLKENKKVFIQNAIESNAKSYFGVEEIFKSKIGE